MAPKTKAQQQADKIKRLEVDRATQAENITTLQNAVREGQERVVEYRGAKADAERKFIRAENGTAGLTERAEKAEHANAFLGGYKECVEDERKHILKRDKIKAKAFASRGMRSRPAYAPSSMR